MRLMNWWARDALPQELTGLQFSNQRKHQEGKRTSLSLLSGHHASIISSSSKSGEGVFLSLPGETRSTDYCLCVQRACPRDHWLPELTGQDVGLMRPLFYCFGTRLMLLLHGFVVKHASLVLQLSKPTFLNNRYLTGVSHIFYLQSSSGINYLITYLASLVVQMVKPAMWESQVRQVGGEDTLEKETATHFSIPNWSIPWT